VLETNRKSTRPEEKGGKRLPGPVATQLPHGNALTPPSAMQTCHRRDKKSIKRRILGGILTFSNSSISVLRGKEGIPDKEGGKRISPVYGEPEGGRKDKKTSIDGGSRERVELS